MRPCRAVAVSAGVMFAMVPSAGWAQEASSSDVSDLRALVARQSSLIDALQQRVAALEKNSTTTAMIAQRPPPVQAGLPTQSTASAQLAKGEPSPGLEVDWSQGAPTFRLPNGSSFHVRGRIYVDASTTSGSRFDTRNLSGTELNSARLGVDGTFGEHWGYKVELDFADGTASLKENYIDYFGHLFGQDLQIFAGNKTGDRSIDGSSYDDYVPFFQRSMLATSIGPEKGIFGVGLLAKLIGQDWHVGLDVVGDDANGNAGTASDTLTYTARATFTPKVGNLGRVHFGAWGYYENISQGGSPTITRTVYPGEHFNDNLRLTMTPILDARSSSGAGGEVGVMHGPFWAFGEYGRRHIDAGSGDRTWKASVAEAGWFITGESVNFSPKVGSWVEMKPRRSVFDGGPGAIELLARYETADLGHEDVGGSGHDLTVGADWYLSGNVRVMADWVHWRVDNPVEPYVGSDGGNTFNVRLDTSF